MGKFSPCLCRYIEVKVLGIGCKSNMQLSALIKHQICHENYLQPGTKKPFISSLLKGSPYAPVGYYLSTFTLSLTLSYYAMEYDHHQIYSIRMLQEWIYSTLEILRK